MSYIGKFKVSKEEEKETIGSYRAWMETLIGSATPFWPELSFLNKTVASYADLYKSQDKTKDNDISYKQFNADLKNILKARDILAKYSQEAADLFLEKYITFAIEEIVTTKVESIIENKVEEYLAKKIELLSSNNK